MPLNSHSYLVGQGWQGTGKALREGGISRPVVITQKKSLAGVGKDRDEAYPFWDHVFTAAATSIKVKLYKDDGDEDTDTPQPSGSGTPIDRTSTGIISNKPQKVGLSVLETLTASKSTRMSVMSLAKRESARRGLYSQFFRGPILGPDTEESQVLEVAQRSSPSRSESDNPKCSVSITEPRKGKKRKSQEESEGETGLVQKKRKSKGGDEIKEEREERKRLKRLKKEGKKGEVSEVGSDGKTESGLAKMSTAPGSAMQGGDLGDRSRREDRKKNGKRKERESTVHHDA